MKVCSHCGSVLQDDSDPKRTRPVRAREMRDLVEGTRPSDPPTNPQGFSTKELPTDPDRLLAKAAHRRNVQAAFAIALTAILIGWLYLKCGS